MAGRTRTAIFSLEPARAACHPVGRSEAEEARQCLDTPLAEAGAFTGRRPTEPPTTDVRDYGSTLAYSDIGGNTGCAGSPLICSFSSLPGLK